MATFLFDLDGTLLAVDSATFLHAYFGELIQALQPVMPTDRLAADILTATARMQADTRPGITNREKFRNEFDALTPGLDHESVWATISQFYATTFDNLQRVMVPNEPLRRSVEYLRSRRHRLLLTTNPIFPEIATHKRLRWAGYTTATFEYISTMENSTFCKPHVEYWQHVLTCMHVDAADAVAVGNDSVEDVSARLAGIGTYLVTDYAIGDVASAGADRCSDAAAFEEWVRTTY